MNTVNAADDRVEAAVDRTLAIAVADLFINDSDPEGDTLIITGTDTTELRGTLVADGTGFAFTPAAGFKGDTSVQYTVSDGLRTDTAIVTIRVTNDNSPSARDDGFAVEEHRILTANVLANDSDADGQALRVTGHGAAANGVLTIAADVIVGGDNNDILAGRGGADRFRFDGDGGSDIIADFSRAQGDREVLEGPGTLALSGASFTFGTTTVTAAKGHAWAAADFIPA